MWWRTLSYRVDDTLFAWGGLVLHTYALFFVAGVFVVLTLVVRSLKTTFPDRASMIETTAFWLIVWGLIGAKLGFVLLYTVPFSPMVDPSLYLPYREGVWQGIRGMSFFGAVIGLSGYLWYATRKQRAFFWEWTDRLALYAPLGIFLGRLGNFWNHELVGRVTTMPWGMYFSDAPLLRHPSTLYEAALEGVGLFVCLFLLRKNAWVRARLGRMTGIFLIGYGVLRFLAEQWREPDVLSGLIGWFSLGAWLALGFLLLGGGLLWWSVSKKSGILQ